MSMCCEFTLFPSTLNVTVVVTVKLFDCPSTGVKSFGLVFGVVVLFQRGGGAGGIRNGPKFNVLGGVGRTVRIFPLSRLPVLLLLLLLLFVCKFDTNFSISIDLRLCALKVLVLPTMPVRKASSGDMAMLSIDSGLSICWPVLVKLLRLDAVSDGVPTKLGMPAIDGVVGLKTAPLLIV